VEKKTLIQREYQPAPLQQVSAKEVVDANADVYEVFSRITKRFQEILDRSIEEEDNNQSKNTIRFSHLLSTAAAKRTNRALRNALLHASPQAVHLFWDELDGIYRRLEEKMEQVATLMNTVFLPTEDILEELQRFYASYTEQLQQLRTVLSKLEKHTRLSIASKVLLQESKDRLHELDEEISMAMQMGAGDKVKQSMQEYDALMKEVEELGQGTDEQLLSEVVHSIKSAVITSLNSLDQDLTSR